MDVIFALVLATATPGGGFPVYGDAFADMSDTHGRCFHEPGALGDPMRDDRAERSTRRGVDEAEDVVGLAVGVLAEGQAKLAGEVVVGVLLAFGRHRRRRFVFAGGEAVEERERVLRERSALARHQASEVDGSLLLRGVLRRRRSGTSCGAGAPRQSQEGDGKDLLHGR